MSHTVSEFFKFLIELDLDMRNNYFLEIDRIIISGYLFDDLLASAFLNRGFMADFDGTVQCKINDRDCIVSHLPTGVHYAVIFKTKEKLNDLL